MKNKLILFVFFLGSLISSTGHIQAQCSTCNVEITTGSGTLELSPDTVTCINETLTFDAIKWADNATLCIAPGKTLTIVNHMFDNEAKYNLTLELYGKLAMGNPEFNPNNLIMNIHSGGSFEAGNTAFKGSNVIINNQGGIFHVDGLNLNDNNSGTINIFNSESAIFQTKGNLNVGDNIALIYNNEGRLDIGNQFGLSKISKFSNCGEIETAGFNLMSGTLYNTGKFFIRGNLDGEGKIYNYGTIELNAIQGGNKKIYNYGTIDVLSNSIVDMDIHGPTELPYYGEFKWKGQVGGVNNIEVFGNQLFKNTNGDSSLEGMLGNTSALKPQTGSSIIWGNCTECEVVNKGVECIDAETGEGQKKKKNYWLGGKVGAPNKWDDEENWTANRVPGKGEDIEFATEENNGPGKGGNDQGAAKAHLYLDDVDHDSSGGRIIGDLINKSQKNLIVTQGNQLTVNGKVHDDNTGGILVKADSLDKKPSGTLIFKYPMRNLNVGATVEFYNKAYDCADCGFYTRSWQYFGIPLQQSTAFPYDDVDGNETVNQWVESFNGNKWQPAPHTPDDKFEAFRGYQITNDVNEQPKGIYSFEGDLYVRDASVAVTRTDDANYPGANLVGNSYTAAIPISRDALKFPEEGVDKTVYLFNTGTRDQWRKLNGTAIEGGYRSGQYLAVPVELGGQDDFPDKIPSMHAFMVLVQSGSEGILGIDYSKLVKNTTVNRGNGEKIVTRSVNNKGTTTAKSTIPSLVMDVIGEQSADRIWIFTKEGTTNGFDNGWDGRKMAESGIVQFYVADEADKDHFQVATVPGLDNLPLGFEADVDGEYTIEFALSDHWANEEIYLNDLASGTQTRITNGGSYRFAAKKGDLSTRFSLSSSGGILTGGEAAKITVSSIDAGKITIHNRSDNDCSVFISNTAGKLLKRLEVVAGDEQTVEDMPGGTHVVRLQNGVINDARKIVVR